MSALQQADKCGVKSQDTKPQDIPPPHLEQLDEADQLAKLAIAGYDPNRDTIQEDIDDATAEVGMVEEMGDEGYDDFQEAAAKASEGSLAPSTLKSYLSLFDEFKTNFVPLFAPRINAKDFNIELAQGDHRVPLFIQFWIIESCNSPDEKDERLKGRGNTYTHALKMRAAASHGFARMYRCGKEPWRKNRDGAFEGNPSLSDQVSKYMKSLQRGKVRAGEVSTSARAIKERDIERLWRNTQEYQEEWYPQTLPERHWGGYEMRTQMCAMYILAFLCMLRFDEVLQLRWEDIEIVGQLNNHKDEDKGEMKVTLGERKTHKYGDIKPFHLYHNRERLWLDPTHAIYKWATVCHNKDPGRELKGYVFRRLDKRGQPVRDSKLSADVFNECFKRHLLDIGINPTAYGTHSFRRGGCQYFSSVQGWSLTKLCDWGGWSLNFDNLTIVRYLHGWNDDPVNRREDFLLPDKYKKGVCKECRRPLDYVELS